VLLSAAGHQASNSVTFTFSVPVTAPTAADFFIVNPNGKATPGSAAPAPSVSGNTVTVTFAAGVAGINGAGVVGVATQGTVLAAGSTTGGAITGTPSAVTDVQGNANAPGDVAATSS